MADADVLSEAERQYAVVLKHLGRYDSYPDISKILAKAVARRCLSFPLSELSLDLLADDCEKCLLPLCDKEGTIDPILDWFRLAGSDTFPEIAVWHLRSALIRNGCSEEGAAQLVAVIVAIASISGPAAELVSCCSGEHVAFPPVPDARLSAAPFNAAFAGQD